jgi:hypothetical protein
MARPMHGFLRVDNIVLRWHMYSDPDVFEIPEPAKPRRWLAALVMTGIVIAGTLALVVINEAPHGEPQITVTR